LSLYVDIEKTFPDFKLSVQLEGEDEVVALLGSSGCGKSLTLKCIAGIETPDKGSIVINDETVFDSEQQINIPPQKRQVGYLFQNYALFPTMTVWNNIACVIKKPKYERREIVDNIIKNFQLDAVKKLYPRQISGGQQQRTALARILVSEPKILMLDEPFSALDTHLKWKMEQEIAAVLSEFGGTTVFVSHNRDEVYRLSDKIAVMDNGRIETTGMKKDIFDFPKTLSAALMTGCKNFSKAEKIDDYHVKAADWGIALKTSRKVPDNVKHLGVRAHHLQLVYVKENGENIFPCHIHKTIDEPFERIFVFSFATDTKPEATLQLEQPKDLCGEWESKEFMIRVPTDKIMCLE
jgi:molybdate transport system ATP-binding protein